MPVSLTPHDRGRSPRRTRSAPPSRPATPSTGAALELGALMVDATTLTGVPIRIPLGMLNRHGLVAGATGTGKTKTLQLLAEQLSAAGVPVFAADIKGDLSGLSVPGAENPKVAERARRVGQTWQASGFPVEFFALGGQGTGIAAAGRRCPPSARRCSPRCSGSTTPRSPRSGWSSTTPTRRGCRCSTSPTCARCVTYLTSDEGKAELKGLGGLSSATAGVILRELIAFSDQGADAFFGEPEFDTRDLLRTTPDGQGLISLRGAAQPAGPAGGVLHVPDVAARRPVPRPARGRRRRQAQAGVLLRRGAPAVRRRLQGLPRRDRADRAADPVQGCRRLLRDPVADRRTRRRARPARLAHPAPAARGHAQRRQGAQADGEHLPALGVRRPRPR